MGKGYPGRILISFFTSSSFSFSAASVSCVDIQFPIPLPFVTCNVGDEDNKMLRIVPIYFFFNHKILLLLTFFTISLDASRPFESTSFMASLSGIDIHIYVFLYLYKIPIIIIHKFQFLSKNMIHVFFLTFSLLFASYISIKLA